MSAAALRSSARILHRLPRLAARLNEPGLRRTVAVSHPRRLQPTGASKAGISEHPPAHPTVLISSPSQKDIDEQELDVELLPPQSVRVNITDRAAEQLRTISTRQQNPNAALRVVIESGGCHGYQYKLELATSQSPEDYHFEHPTIKPSNVFVDAVSLSLLNGSSIDYATELIGSTFRVLDNPHAKGSSCGCGISWELNLDEISAKGAPSST